MAEMEILLAFNDVACKKFEKVSRKLWAYLRELSVYCFTFLLSHDIRMYVHSSGRSGANMLTIIPIISPPRTL